MFSRAPASFEATADALALREALGLGGLRGRGRGLAIAPLRRSSSLRADAAAEINWYISFRSVSVMEPARCLRITRKASVMAATLRGCAIVPKRAAPAARRSI